MRTDFVVYFHVFPNTEKPFYVGKGTKNRALSLAPRNPLHKNLVAKYGAEVIIKHDSLSEDAAFELERKYIELYGRRDLGTGCLSNMTGGGEGTSGMKMPTEAIEKIKAFQRGRKKSAETCARLSLAITGSKFSEERRKICSLSQMGKKLSSEHKQSVGNGLRSRNEKDIVKWKEKLSKASQKIHVVEIDGVRYDSHTTAAQALNVKPYNVVRRCRNENYPTWKIISSSR